MVYLKVKGNIVPMNSTLYVEMCDDGAYLLVDGHSRAIAVFDSIDDARKALDWIWLQISGCVKFIDLEQVMDVGDDDDENDRI